MPTTQSRRSRLGAVMREGERVTALELFFDLVFVLAITQCTALMSHDLSWSRLAQGVLALAVLWWAWVGYAWLTSAVNPEEGTVRGAIFSAMAALLVVALCVPHAFDRLALTFAVAYGFVRAAHIGLFRLAARDDPALRRSVGGLAVGAAIGVALLAAASACNGLLQGGLWVAALAIDMAGPYVYGSEGWRIEPAHFAERHALIVIIALGESIVAIGVGSEVGVDAGVVTASILGVALSAALWWAYFDVVAPISARRLVEATPGRERNEMARDSFSYLHFPLVAGIVLAALGLERTLAHVGDPLGTIPTFAMLGGVASYLLGHVAFRYRNAHTVNRHRLLIAICLLAVVPLADGLPALATLGGVTGVLWAMIAWETARYGEGRQQLRRTLGA